MASYLEALLRRFQGRDIETPPEEVEAFGRRMRPSNYLEDQRPVGDPGTFRYRYVGQPGYPQLGEVPEVYNAPTQNSMGDMLGNRNLDLALAYEKLRRGLPSGGSAAVGSEMVPLPRPKPRPAGGLRFAGDDIEVGSQSYLPPGAKFDEPKGAPAQSTPVYLPPGAKFDERTPQTPAEEAQAAREAAAERTRRGVIPLGERPSAPGESGRQEGGVTRAIESVVPGVLKPITEFTRQALEEGTVDPRTAMEVAATFTPGAPGKTLTGAIVRGAAKTPAEQLGVEIPKVAEAGGTKQAIARQLSDIPVIGTPLRRGAERASAQLEEAATRVLPEGGLGSSLAGTYIKQGIEGAQKELPSRFKTYMRWSDDQMVDEVMRLASSRHAGDIKTLNQIGRLVPPEFHGAVQSALINKMGTVEGRFDPATWVRNYGSLSDAGKTGLFGTAGAELRHHLDNIEAVARRAPRWEQFSGDPSILKGLGGSGALGAAVGMGWIDPITALGAAIPARMYASALSKPAGAASIAAWSRAYERVVRSGGGPAARGAFVMATRNLGNTLGVDIDPNQVMPSKKTE